MFKKFRTFKFSDAKTFGRYYFRTFRASEIYNVRNFLKVIYRVQKVWHKWAKLSFSIHTYSAVTCFSYILYLESDFLSVAYLTVTNLVQLGISFSQVHYTGSQVVIQSIHLLKECYLQLILNESSKILLSKWLDCRCMAIHPAIFSKFS